jgi:hypothetical protein
MRSLLTTLAGGNYLERSAEKQRVASHLRVRGSVRRPDAPRDAAAQPASRGVLLTWKLPQFHDDVAGWRVYMNTESNLVSQIRDKGTRQIFVPLSTSATPTPVNLMVCAFSTLGRESAKIIIQATPLAETGAPAIPVPPPGYLTEAAGGKNRSLIRFKGETQYVRQ